MTHNIMHAILTGGKRPFVEAHRGAPSFAPENTIPAFEKALDINADLIEIDVQFTKDQEIVLFHDSTLDDKTNGSGFIKDHTLHELKQLDVGSWFSETFSGEKILTLEEVLNWAKNKIWLSIELKHILSCQDIFVKRTVECIESSQMENQVQIISFNHEMLAMVRKYSMSIMTSAICPCKISKPIKYLKSIGGQVYNGPGYFLSKKTVKDIQQAGFYVNAGMVDDVGLWRQYESWGVDLMCTNVPHLMVKERGKQI